ncbi:hypothetical protein HAX54_047034, partial [Datura stramonium]|nr:hypothetical protein [Datura stramonium]
LERASVAKPDSKGTSATAKWRLALCNTSNALTCMHAGIPSHRTAGHGPRPPHGPLRHRPMVSDSAKSNPSPSRKR